MNPCRVLGQRAVLNCIDYLSRFGYTREQVRGPSARPPPARPHVHTVVRMGIMSTMLCGWGAVDRLSRFGYAREQVGVSASSCR